MPTEQSEDQAKPNEPQAAATADAPASNDGADAGALTAEIERLKQELAEASERAERYHSNWQRSAADFQNWKRRADQERSDALKLGEAALMAEMLRVLDDIERAFQALPRELFMLSWIEGIDMIYRKMFSIMQARGLSPIEAQGQEFDPHTHEAVLRDEDGDPSEQTHVVAELQRGYRFQDRVLRPTMVKVGKPPAPEATAEAAPADASEQPEQD